MPARLLFMGLSAHQNVSWIFLHTQSGWQLNLQVFFDSIPIDKLWENRFFPPNACGELSPSSRPVTQLSAIILKNHLTTLLELEENFWSIHDMRYPKHNSETNLSPGATLKLFTPPSRRKMKDLFINLTFNNVKVFTVEIESFLRPSQTRQKHNRKFSFLKRTST